MNVWVRVDASQVLGKLGEHETFGDVTTVGRCSKMPDVRSFCMVPQVLGQQATVTMVGRLL